ncbi:MAG TPA: DUF1565 domain-containing protein, partial [Thermoplasmata archaeon]|nr:DUF1565 domain-containing protein [Thermoplasmata archaeon]
MYRPVGDMMTVRGLICSLLMFAAAVLIGIPYASEATTYVVDDDGGSWANYTTIQDAVDNATDGDTILVYNGTYNEDVLVYKGLTIVGNGTAETTVIGTGNGSVFRVTAFNVTLRSMTIRGGGSGPSDAGIRMEHVRTCAVNMTRVVDNGHGIFLNDSWLVEILDSDISSNDGYGILGENLTDSRIADCTLSDNALGSIALADGSDSDVLEGNTMSATPHGVLLNLSTDCELYDNIMTGCGIWIRGAYLNEYIHTIPSNNTVNAAPVYYLLNGTGVTVPPNVGEIIVVNSDNTTISGHTIENGSVGLSIAYSTSTSVDSCEFNGHSAFGVMVHKSRYTEISDTMALDNGIYGVAAVMASGISLSNVNASYSGEYGLLMIQSNHSTVRDVAVIGNGTEQGVHLAIISDCDIENVTVTDCGIGFGLVRASDLSLTNIIARDNVVAGVYVDDRSRDDVFDHLIASDNGYGLFVANRSRGHLLVNSTLTGSSSADIRLLDADVAGDDDPALTTLNVTLTTVDVMNSTLVVRNFLHVRALKGGSPLANVDVKVLDGNTTVYASSGFGGNDSRTGSDGSVRWIAVTDRVYAGSAPAAENTTTVSARYLDWEEIRDVNMSTTHTETFNVTTNVTVIYVDDDNAGDPDMDGSEEHPYDTIQRGIDNASANDTIRVYEGDYSENVVVDVPGISIIGNGTANTTVDAGNSGTVMLINVSNVTIKRLHLTDAGTQTEDSGIHLDGSAGAVGLTVHDVHVDLSQRGIFIDGSSDVVIINVTLDNNAFGLYGDTSDDISIAGSSIASNTNSGMYLTDVNGASITDGCSIHTHGTYGIYMNNCAGGVISDASITSNTNSGVYLTSSHDIWILDSVLSSNGEGIYITATDNVTVVGCEVRSSTSNGIALRASSADVRVEGCEIRDNNNGISVTSSVR